MSPRTTSWIALAALFAAVGTSRSDSETRVHTLPGGQIHKGELPEGETTMEDEMSETESSTTP